MDISQQTETDCWWKDVKRQELKASNTNRRFSPKHSIIRSLNTTADHQNPTKSSTFKDTHAITIPTPLDCFIPVVQCGPKLCYTFTLAHPPTPSLVAVLTFTTPPTPSIWIRYNSRQPMQKAWACLIVLRHILLWQRLLLKLLPSPSTKVCRSHVCPIAFISARFSTRDTGGLNYSILQ